MLKDISKQVGEINVRLIVSRQNSGYWKLLEATGSYWKLLELF